jgi:hypothetical protein
VLDLTDPGISISIPAMIEKYLVHQPGKFNAKVIGEQLSILYIVKTGMGWGYEYL